jgi:hypothetical protein
VQCGSPDAAPRATSSRTSTSIAASAVDDIWCGPWVWQQLQDLRYRTAISILPTPQPRHLPQVSIFPDS